MKKVAVFGGSGFLGTYLVNELLKRNYEVHSFDLNAPSDDTGVKFTKLDILDRTKISDAFAAVKFDIVYNLAGFANLDKAVEFPVETVQLNVMGNLYILDECRKHNVSRYVYASSAYAMSDKGTFYGISKLSSEKIIEEYGEKYKLPFTILRYGSIYSEQNFENNYIFNLVKKAIEKGEINHEGDGNEIREYIHAADAAKLSADIIEKNDFVGKHLILTGVERIKRVELFNMINEILGNKIKINLVNDGYKHHYKYTPYSFIPQESQKLIPNPYIDMGQGILNCIREVHKK
ncbi:MAG: NAD-dependent epimerase/dehydratase family protein [Crocinitomicaceae bacterium]|nr:NAD-dependent epimerase/dehydratase family protein [Crocinitomicaceae bacterium]